MAAEAAQIQLANWSADPDTVGGRLLRAARTWGARDALVIGTQRASWLNVFAQSVRRARGLMAAGVGRGDKVGLLMTNAWDCVITFYASALLGACYVPLNARYRRDDLAYAIPKADLKVLLIGGQGLPHTDFRAMLGDVFPELEDWSGGPLQLPSAPQLTALYNLCDPREHLWPTEAALDAAAHGITEADVRGAAAMVRADDPCLMIFSSGTTARPKACLLSHQSLTRAGRALSNRFGMSADDRFWDPLPLFHMSTMLPLAACCASGAPFIGVVHFEPGAALAELARERVTIAYPTFPTITTAMIAHPDFATTDLAQLRIVLNVGPVDLLRRYMAALPQAVHVNCYGLTEATGVPFYSELTDTEAQRLETGGRPFEGVSVRIADPETGAILADGARGEIQLKGWCVFQGYYKDAERTAEAFTPDGWLRTGDIGALTEERIVYLGRFKDMLKIGGENVAAQEIESFLMTHPAVLLAQVIGVPDEQLVEVAAAFVELKPGASLSEMEVVHHCAGQIASYKIPRYVRFVTQWPQSATKIQKFRLAQDFQPAGRLDVRGLIAAGRT